MDITQPLSSRDPQHKKEDVQKEDVGKKKDMQKESEGKKKEAPKKEESLKCCAYRPFIIDTESTGDQQGNIFRVHHRLRKSNPNAYSPMLISIGPYYGYDEYLTAMKGCKKRCCDSLITRRGDSVDRYRQSLMNRLEEAPKSYALFPPMEHNRDRFVAMLLLDGSFIVESVRECWESQQQLEAAARPDRIREKRPKATNGPVFGFHWMCAQAFRDLLVFDNQLPYFVPKELYKMSCRDQTVECSFHDMLKCALKSILPAELYPFPVSKCPNDLPETKHLLHAAHILCCPSSTYDHQNSYRNNNCIEINIDQGRALLYQMRSATELQEAGVSFKKVSPGTHNKETNGISSIFDIKFHNGVREIPSLTIADSTESLFRNLIAYEQYSPGLNPKHFSDYATFMDCLINSSRNIAILRLEGILVNLLGDDRKVADMFNKLGDGVVMSPTFYYSEVFNKVDEHCRKPWNTAKAILRRDYFNSPWAGISQLLQLSCFSVLL